MSYLDAPRLHFSGRFFANPGTLNNWLVNYSPSVPLQPAWQGTTERPIVPQYAGYQYCNPNGLGYFAWHDCTVKSAVSSDGGLLASAATSEVIDARVESHRSEVAKIVDLDPDQQSVSQIYGLSLHVALANGASLSGPLQTAALSDLWYGRVPHLTGDGAGSGVFQTVMPAEKLIWSNLGRSRFLRELKAQSEAGLSVKWMADAYQANNVHPQFNFGRLVGTLGPAKKGEPLRFVAGRRLLPVDRRFGPAPWILDTERAVARIDLSNSVPLQAPGGESYPLGSMFAVILDADGTHLLPPPIDYTRRHLEQASAISDIWLTDQQLKGLFDNRLGVAIISPDGRRHLVLAEHPSRKWANVDQTWLRMMPGETASVDIHARRGNGPLAGEKLAIRLLSDNSNGRDNNRPSSAVTFDQEVTTDAQGRAVLNVTANVPEPLPPQRRVIDSQVYFLGGPWQEWGELHAQSGGGVLTVLVFGDFVAPQDPNWDDHIGPLLRSFARLFPGMKSIVDLASYDQVVKNADRLKRVLSYPLDHARYMPVTRDLSPAKVEMILAWIDTGCPHSPTAHVAPPSSETNNVRLTVRQSDAMLASHDQ